jgi:hypothetical protein
LIPVPPPRRSPRDQESSGINVAFTGSTFRILIFIFICAHLPSRSGTRLRDTDVVDGGVPAALPVRRSLVAIVAAVTTSTKP